MKQIVLQTSARLSNDDHQTLQLLYTPMAGLSAIGLFQLLHQRINQETLHVILPLRELFELTGLTPKAFDHDIDKLIALGLLDRFSSDPETLQLYQPLPSSDFLANPLLRHQLFASVSETTFTSLQKRFSAPIIPSGTPKEIGFSDIFKASVLDSPESTNHKQPVHKSTTLPSFDINQWLEQINTAYRPERISKELVHELSAVKVVYDLSYEDLAKVYLFSLDDQTQQVDVTKIGKAAKDIYSYQGVEQKVVENSAPSSNALLATFQRMSTKELLEELSGTAAAPTDLEIARKLVSVNKLPVEMVNYLFYFVLHQTKGKMPSYNYFAKIANEWGRNKLTTIDQVDTYIKNKQSKQAAPWLAELKEEQGKADSSMKASQSKKEKELSIKDVAARFEKL
jgi:replication initiation and membrane attachment protein